VSIRITISTAIAIKRRAHRDAYHKRNRRAEITPELTAGFSYCSVQWAIRYKRQLPNPGGQKTLLFGIARTAMRYRGERTRLGTSVTLQAGARQVGTTTSQTFVQI
jgi:hypothetical protein